MKGIAFAALMIGSAALASTAAAETALDMTKSLAPLLAKAGPDDEGSGLLLLTLDAQLRRWGRKNALGDFRLEMTNSRNQQVLHVDVSGTATQLVRLPAGRYCITSIKTSERTSTTDCSTPFVDVHKNSASWSGNITATVSGKTLKITDRNHDLMPETFQLSPEDQQRLSEATEVARRMGYHTFFLASPGQLPRIIRLAPHGQASLESFTVASSSIDSTQWTESGDHLIVDWEDGSGWTLMPADQLASLTRAHKVSAGEQVFVHRNTLWFTQTSDPRCWHWRTCGQRFRDPVQWGADYTETPNFHRISGIIRFQFRLKARGEEWVADDLRIIDSTVDPEHHANVSETLASTSFIADLVPMRDGFAEATIQFTPTASGLDTVLKLADVRVSRQPGDRP